MPVKRRPRLTALKTGESTVTLSDESGRERRQAYPCFLKRRRAVFPLHRTTERRRWEAPFAAVRFRGPFILNKSGSGASACNMPVHGSSPTIIQCNGVL